MKSYVLNQETQRIELHFTKDEYNGLTAEQKKSLKSKYLFSGKAKAWVSRSTKAHYFAIEIAEKLGFTNGGSTGERLTYEEEMQRKAEKAENKVERYEQYAVNAVKRAENLQSSLNKMHGDIAFFTQPNINSASGRSFANYREKLFNRYNKGFEEYRKSDYFKEKAATAAKTANMEKLKDRTYLSNRIIECNKNIKVIEKNIVWCEENNKTDQLQQQIKKCEYEIDKLAFMQNCLDQLGKCYTKENIKTGYLVKIRDTWYKVIKANKVTVEGKIVDGGAAGMVLKHPYTEIEEIKIPTDYKEPQQIINPYVVGDLLVHYSCGSDRIIKAYQVLKTTAKGVQLQEINIKDNKPLKDNFKDFDKIRRQIVKSKYSDFVGCYDGNWQLNKYNMK